MYKELRHQYLKLSTSLPNIHTTDITNIIQKYINDSYTTMIIRQVYDIVINKYNIYKEFDKCIYGDKSNCLLNSNFPYNITQIIWFSEYLDNTFSNGDDEKLYTFGLFKISPLAGSREINNLFVYYTQWSWGCHNFDGDYKLYVSKEFPNNFMSSYTYDCYCGKRER